MRLESRERDRRALEWMEREKARLYEAGATHPVTRRNVVRVADTWYVQGSQMRRAVFKHDHLAAFLKNIYRDSGRRLDVVHAVLNGYGNERSLDTGDVRLLLAFMIDPLPLRRFMESKRGKNEWRPADRSHVEALFREQEMREKLAHHIAGWFDQ